MRVHVLASLLLLLLVCAACGAREQPTSNFTGADNEVGLMIQDPGHFHAALVQKYDYSQIDPAVHVYAPVENEVGSYLDLIERFNTREETPTNWTQRIYVGDGYQEKMVEEKPGNLMVVAGNNARKIGYIQHAVENGINVLADKPMVITPDDFPTLRSTVEKADERGLLVNDIMTERYVAATRLQRALSQNEELFGELREGSPEKPAITKESVHHFYKMVAGEPLIRPAWFFDVDQQGEAIADVSTHLVDLILWEAFPGEPIDYQTEADDVEVLSARSWDTEMTPAQFTQVTGQQPYPEFLQSDVDSDSTLNVAANGEFTFTVRGVHAKVSAEWDYENPGGGDTHYSIMRGTQANLTIRQGEAQNFEPVLYVEPVGKGGDQFAATLKKALKDLSPEYEGVTAESSEFGWRVNIPERYEEGHEEHFASVTEQYLQYLVDGQLPEWERTNLLTKYYLTTTAYEMSR